MKIRYIIAGLVVLLLTACSDKFLQLDSHESLTTSNYFSSEADFKAAVNGIYTNVRQWFGPTTNISTSPAILIGDMHSDNARYYFNPNYRAAVPAENIADFVPDNQRFSSYWTNFYVWISRSNQILGSIDAVDFDATSKNNLKGQALFFRAYSYWWIIRLYGKGVLHTDPVNTLDQTSLPLSDEAALKTQVLADAKEAATLLLDKTTQQPGRVTRGSAFMLLADVYMWYKEWALAEAALKNIKGYSLVPNYANIFSTTNKNNSESIFEIQYSSSAATYASTFVYNHFPYPATAAQVAAWTGVSNPASLSEGEMLTVPNPELIASYEPGDKRLDASIANVQDANGVKMPMCSKYLHAHATFKQCDDDFMVYRYAGALLYLAEALNEQGKPTEAVVYLNQVRNRAGLANTTATSQADVRTAIEKERRVELAFEGSRWWDLVRTNKVQEVISAYGAKVKAAPQNYYFTTGQSPVPSAFTDFSKVFNLPDDEVLYNPNF